MSQTIFLKDNVPHIRLKEGEFQVSPECYTKGISRDGESYWYNVDTGTTTVGIGEKERFEWLGGVELIEMLQIRIGNDWKNLPYQNDYKGNMESTRTIKIARLIPEEKKELNDKTTSTSVVQEGNGPNTSTPPSSTAHSFTEGGYKEFEEIDPVYEVGKNKDDGNKNLFKSSEPQEKGEYYGDCCPLCGHVVHPVKIGYLIRWYCENGDCLNCNPVKMHSVVESVSAPSESQEEQLIDFGKWLLKYHTTYDYFRLNPNTVLGFYYRDKANNP